MSKIQHLFLLGNPSWFLALTEKEKKKETKTIKEKMHCKKYK